jgi:hypothetical protein
MSAATQASRCTRPEHGGEPRRVQAVRPYNCPSDVSEVGSEYSRRSNRCATRLYRVQASAPRGKSHMRDRLRLNHKGRQQYGLFCEAHLCSRADSRLYGKPSRSSGAYRLHHRPWRPSE